MQSPDKPPICLVPQGQLTLEILAEPRATDFGAVYFLKFIEPLNIAELAAYAARLALVIVRPQADDPAPGGGRDRDATMKA